MAAPAGQRRWRPKLGIRVPRTAMGIGENADTSIYTCARERDRAQCTRERFQQRGVAWGWLTCAPRVARCEPQEDHPWDSPTQ